jgi:O-acetylserine/cysteine efflux transporter
MTGNSKSPDKMAVKDIFLALLVVTIWGANFTVIKLGLANTPPMLLAALRYTLTAFPAIFFIRPPEVKWQSCAAYGLTVGVGQFACLFYAMNIGMPAGLASVVLQSQAFFTLLFAIISLRESLSSSQLLGLIIAVSGLTVIGANINHKAGISVIPVSAFLLTLLAAAFWGLSNIIVRHMAIRADSEGKQLDIFSLVVWSALVPPLPFLTLALIMDTPQTIVQTFQNFNALSVFSVFYLAFCATLFGFGTWSGLLARYPTGRVAPLSLLVPVTGLITAQIVLNEYLTALQWIAGSLILLGLFLSNLNLPHLSKLNKAKQTLYIKLLPPWR